MTQELTHENYKETYKVVRVYFRSGRRNILFKNRTLQFAQDWCSRSDTKKTRKGEIVWMDCFFRESAALARGHLGRRWRLGD